MPWDSVDNHTDKDWPVNQTPAMSIWSLFSGIGYSKDALWPTPMARLGTLRGAQAKRYKAVGRSNDLDDAVAHFDIADAPRGVQSVPAGVLWPTPTARDGKSGPGTTPKRTGGMNLRTAVHVHSEIFPTPISRDWKSGSVSDKTKNKNSRPLSEYVVDANKPGQLNPGWVEWLQGFPQDWTVV